MLLAVPRYRSLTDDASGLGDLPTTAALQDASSCRDHMQSAKRAYTGEIGHGIGNGTARQHACQMSSHGMHFSTRPVARFSPSRVRIDDYTLVD
ncbi:hypothetical protein CMEL01_06238 [Colletotrichum melonis]|uniref:Uncharacterized protein n=1 Tax=Colletotrichum melonis TaxID=1209925 RepID=A0AAI9U908_9PEZI|nr:hypothetical protein CSPX01_00935 [Colletotrichum filicis]KAK1451664.1 hypothetical protein CMEL01_06238 [Colletotrichum melonis]